MSAPSSRMRPALGVSKPASTAEQRGLAAAGGPEQGEELVLADVERHAVDGG